MEKIKSSSFLLFWSFLGLGAMITIWFLPWRFQVNDDVIMMWLVSGAYTGTPESYAVFIHPILSWIFSKLYTIVPSIPWYPLTWFMVMYLSYFAFIALIDRKLRSASVKIVWCLFVLGLSIHFLFFLQFSVVSAFAISAGLGNRFTADDKKIGAFNFQWFDVLILLGLLIRIEVLFLVIVGLLGLQILLLRNFAGVKILILPTFILGFGYCFTGFWVTTNGLSDLHELDKLRSAVFDHPVLQLNKEAYKAIDYQLFSFSNGLMDFQTDELSRDKLLEWKELLDHKRVESINWRTIGSSLYTFVIHERFFLLFMLFFFTFRLIEDWKQALKAASIVVAVVLLLSPFFLLKVQVYVLVFLLYFIWTFIYSKEPSAKIDYSSLFVPVLLVTIGLHISNIVSQPTREVITRKVENSLLEASSNDYGELFLVASSEVYARLIPGKPVDFKLLGWITLWEKYRSDGIRSDRVYLIEKAIYDADSLYFKKIQRRGLGSNRLTIFEE